MASSGSEHEVVLRTERLVLRRFTPDDVDLLVDLDSDPEVMHRITGGRPTTRAEIEDDYLPAFLAYYTRYPGYGFFAAHERAGGEFLGWFHLRPRPGDPEDEPELGYRLRRSCWGRGYASEGSRALVGWAFAELGARRVVAETMAVHSASRRVMEMAGLRYVRTFHQPWPDAIDGAEYGDVAYALDRSEWAGKPLIGLTSYGERAAFGVWDLDAVLLPRSYTDMVVAAGGVPVLIPARVEAAEAVDHLDAVILSGGADLDPARYDAHPHARTGAPRPERDAAEIAVLRRALDRGIPVLGVCRGMQVLNVALGGTLTQHLPDRVGHDGHNPSPGVFGPTEVSLTGRVAAALGPAARVQCHHHQALDVLGDGLVVTGRAADGTIEAVERVGGQWVVGVQWHPEQQAADARLVRALVSAACRPDPPS